MVTNPKKTVLGITREDIPYDDKYILKRYTGISMVPCLVTSPFRKNDKHPSVSIHEEGGTVFWKDFGTGDGGNIIGFLAKLWHVDYSEALMKIKSDTEYVMPSFNMIRRYKGKQYMTSSSTIKVQTRPWRDYDTQFWEQFGISQSFCKWCNVHPISKAFFTKIDPKTSTERTVCVDMDRLAYAYFEWKDGKESVKLYQPYSQSMKWLSKHDASVWDLWKQAFRWAKEKSNKNVVITSSRKDAMCIWENLGVPAMSLQGEGYIPKPQVMQQVIDTFENVYLWYDNDFQHEHDNPGQDNAKKLLEEYPSLKNICIPSELRSKDPSDLVKNHGVNKLKEVWIGRN